MPGNEKKGTEQKKSASFNDIFDEANGSTTTVQPGKKAAEKKKADFSSVFDEATEGYNTGLKKKVVGGNVSPSPSPDSQSTDTPEESPSPSTGGEVTPAAPVVEPVVPPKSTFSIPGVSAVISGVDAANKAREAKVEEAKRITTPAKVDPVTKKSENPYKSLLTGNTALFVNRLNDASGLISQDIDVDNNSKPSNFTDLSRERNPGSLTSIITSRNGLAGGHMPTAKDRRVFEKEKVLTQPENLKQYNRQRQKELADRENEIRNRQAEITSGYDGLSGMGKALGMGDPAQDALEMENLKTELDNLKKFQETFKDAVADVAKVRVPQKLMSKGTMPTNQEVGMEYLKTIGDPTVSDDEKDLKAEIPVTDIIDFFNQDKNERAQDYSKEKIRFKFEQTGANVMTDYYSHASDRAFEFAKPKLERLSSLYDKLEQATDAETKNILVNSINTLKADPDVEAYISTTGQAANYYNQAQTAIDRFPQVKREQIRRDVNDAFFSLVNDEVAFTDFADKTKDLKAWKRKFNPFNAIFGENPTDDDITKLATATGRTVAEVKEAMKTQKEGFFASSPEGVRAEGFLTGIAKSVDETIGKTLQGSRRILNTDTASIRNRVVGDKMEDYMYNGKGNDLIDRDGMHFNPYSIASTMGRGIGQMTIYGAPALVTGGVGGFAADVLGSSLKAANTAEKVSEGVGTVLAGMAGSYEDAYKEIAAENSDEGTRRGYATLNSLANALPELFYSPAEMLKGTGNIFRSKIAPNLLKEFTEVSAKKGVSAAIYNGLKKSFNVLKETGDVLLAENVEEASTNIATNILDKKYRGKELTPQEVAKQAEETFVMTTLQTLPMAVGAGIHGANDLSHVRKQALFEAGVESDLYKDKLKALFDSGALTQAQLNEKTATVNTMHGIVSNLPKLDENGERLSHEDKVLLAAQQYRIQVNNKRLTQNPVTAEIERIKADTAEATEIQNQVLSGQSYMLDGKPVTREEVAAEVENGTGKFIQISNDPALQSRLNEVGKEVFNAKADVDTYTSGRVGEVAKKVINNEPLTEAEQSVINANKAEVVEAIQSAPELKGEDNPEVEAGNLLAAALEAEPVVPSYTPEEQKALDVLHGKNEELSNVYQSMVKAGPLEFLKFVSEQARANKKSGIISKFTKEVVDAALELYPPKPVEKQEVVGESGKVETEKEREEYPERQDNTRTPVTQKLLNYFSKVNGLPYYMEDLSKGTYISWLQSKGDLGYKVSELLNSPRKAFDLIAKYEAEISAIEKNSSPKTNTDGKGQDPVSGEAAQQERDSSQDQVQDNKDDGQGKGDDKGPLLNETESTSSEPAGAPVNLPANEFSKSTRFASNTDGEGLILSRTLKPTKGFDALFGLNGNVLELTNDKKGQQRAINVANTLKDVYDFYEYPSNDQQEIHVIKKPVVREANGSFIVDEKGLLAFGDKQLERYKAENSKPAEPTEQQMRDTYAQAFGKEYENSIPLPLAYKAALKKLKNQSNETTQQESVQVPDGGKSEVGDGAKGGNEVVQKVAGEGKAEASTEEKVIYLGRNKKKNTLVGKNSEGKSLYEDENGIRSVEEGSGIFSTEPVSLIPTRTETGGTVMNYGIDRTNESYLTAEEKAVIDEAAAQLSAEDKATLDEAGITPADIVANATPEGDIAPSSLQTLIDAGKQNGKIIIASIKQNQNESDESDKINEAGDKSGPYTEGAEGSNGEKPVTDGGAENTPEQKSKTELAKEELRAARAKFKASVRRSMGNTSMNPADLEFMADGIGLIASYVKYGTYKLSDMVKEMLDDGDTEFVKNQDFMRALRAVYGANIINLSREQRIKYNTIDEIEDFYDNELPVLISSIKDIDDNPGDFSALDEAFENEVKSEPHLAFKDAVAGNIITGTKQNIISLRKLAAEKGLNDVSDIEIQELAELAVVELTRAIALSDKRDHQQKLTAISQVYENQPSLNQRSSTRIERQQYSTPAPIAYLGGHFINGISPERVFEPSAGNGLLTIAFPTNIVSVNEIDDTRLRSLGMQSFRSVSSQDATTPFTGLNRTQDGVITNPPFGTAATKVIDGYKISGLAPQMAINALETMKDDGRAAIIIGGHSSYDETGRLQKERFFFNYLHNRYNVVDVININGELYRKQGTSFDIRLLLINGRKAQPSGFAPTQSEVNTSVVNSFAELNDRIQNLNYETSIQSENGQRNDGSIVPGEIGQAGTEQAGNIEPVTTEVSGDNSAGTAAGGQSSAVSGGNVGGQSSTSQSESNGNSPLSTPVGRLPINDSGVPTGTASSRTDKPGTSESDLQRDKPIQSPRQLTSSDIAQEKIKYEPVSKSKPVETVIPTQMASEAQRVLYNIDSQFGGIDNYVLQSLGYNSTDELYKAFSAEQVDALAMSIYQIENNNGMIIGDMTGVGKGRIAAGIIRYGVLHDHKPIFLTEKTTLFSDMYRDLKAIGSKDLVPFIINNYDKMRDPTITDEEGNVVFKSLPVKTKDIVFSSQQLPEDAQWVVGTYSQFNTNSTKPSAKRDFFRSISQGNILILDESHNAGGDGNTGELFQDVLEFTKGVTYLSATFAKTPKNMPVYSVKTAMREANMSKEELINAIEKGGVALQEVVSSQLVESGQMLRRERNFDGVEIDYEMQSEHEQRDRQVADKVTNIIRAVIDFQSRHVSPVIANLDAISKADGEDVGGRSGTSMAGVSNAPFASRVFNIIDQFLFSIKAEAAADAAIEELKKGRKPVLKFKSTMESFLTNEGFQVGDELGKPDFSLALRRSLDTVMKYTTTSAGGDKIPGQLSIADLFPDGRKEFARISALIAEASTGISISPIDLMIDKIQKAGYTVGEITGRKIVLKYRKDGSAVVDHKGGLGTKDIVREFNSGNVDVVMLNASGATGISLHASRDFKDQRQRVMISPQLELDINKEIQGRGRIDRTGQVVRGAYRYIVSSIPAELRLLMMFQAKVKSLDANTTSSQKSKTSKVDLTDDFLNKYGDEIVTEYLKEHPEVNEKLLDPLKLIGQSDDQLANMGTYPDAARKTSGRVAILSSVEQEKFYKEVGDRYKELLDYKNSINENELEVKVVPLEAKTLSTTVQIVGKGGESPFGADSILEKVEANVLRKPMTKEELVKQIEDSLDGRGDPNTIAKDMVKEMEAYFDQKIIDDRAEINRYIEEKKLDAGNTISDPEKLQFRLEELENARGTKIASMENKAEGLRTITRTRLSFFKIGRPLRIPTNSNVAGGVSTYSNGVFIGFEIKSNTKNKYAPSNVRLRFAVEDSRKQITVPSSQSPFLDAILTASFQRFSGMESIIPNWGKGKANADRGIQHILTGNVLQAFGKVKGQLVSYSTDKGELKKGILLNDGEVANLSEQGISVPFSKAYRFIEQRLEDGGRIVSADGDVELNVDRRNRYTIEVPKSRKSGGKYFLNDKLRSIVEYGEFNTVGNKMLGVFYPSDLTQLLEVLTNEFGTNVSLTKAQAGIKENKVDDSKNEENGSELKIAESALADALPSTMDYPVRQGERVDDVLQRIAKANGPYAGVAGQILQMSDGQSLRVPMVVGPIADGRSYYDPISDTIYLTPEHANNDYVILHEVLHAATAKKLPQGLNTIEAITDFINNPASDKNAVQLARIYLQALSSMGSDAYGMKNLDEFIAEVFTNPFFQTQLSKIAWKDTKQNLFQRIVDAIKGMLGIRSASLLEKAITTGSRIISNSSRNVDRRGKMKAPGTALQDALVNMAFLNQKTSMPLGDFLNKIQSEHGYGTSPEQKSNVRKAYEAAADIYNRIKAAKTERELQQIVDSIDAPVLKKNVQNYVDSLPKTPPGAKIDPDGFTKTKRSLADRLVKEGKTFAEINSEIEGLTADDEDYINDKIQLRDAARGVAQEVIDNWKDELRNGKAISRAAQSLLPALLDNPQTINQLTDEFREYQPETESEAYAFAAHWIALLGPQGVMEYHAKEKGDIPALYRSALMVKAIEAFKEDGDYIGEANAATELRKHITQSAQGLQSAQAAYRWLNVSASPEAQQVFVQNIIDSINAKVEELPAAKAIIEARDKMQEEVERALGENENLKAEMEDLIKKHMEEMAELAAATPEQKAKRARKKKTVAEKMADAIDKLQIKDDPSTLKSSVFGAFVPLVNTAIKTISQAVRIGGNIVDAIEDALRDIKKADPRFNLDKEFRNYVGGNIHIPEGDVLSSTFVQNEIRGMVQDIFNGKTVDEVIDDRFFYLEPGPKAKLKRLVKHEVVVAAKAAKAKLKDRRLDEHLDDLADELNTGGTVTTNAMIAKIAKKAGLSYISPAQVISLSNTLRSAADLTGFQKAERIERVTNFLEQRDKEFTSSFIRAMMYLKPLFSYTFAAASLITNKLQVGTNAISTTIEDLVNHGKIDTRYLKLMFDPAVRKKANALAADIMLRGGIPIQNQLALLMPFEMGLPKSRLEEYKIDTNIAAKRWYNRMAQVFMSGANRIANVTDTPATYRIAAGEFYQEIKDRIRKDNPALNETQIETQAWAEMNAVSLQDAIAQADSEYTNRGVVPFDKYQSSFLPKMLSNAAAKTKGIITSETEGSISRLDAKYRRRVAEIMDEERDVKYQEEYNAAIKTASNLLFKESIGDTFVKRTPMYKRITNGVGGLFTSSMNVIVNSMDAIFGGNKYTQFISQNVVFTMAGYVNAAGNIMEKVLEADPRYAAVKILALQTQKGKLSAEDKKYITHRQVQIATNSIVSTAVMALVLGISKSACKDKAVITKSVRTEGDSVTGNLSICGHEIPVRFFPIQARMLQVYSNTMNDPNADEKTKQSVFAATWTGLTSLGWDFFETDPGQYEQNITKAAKALFPAPSPFKIGEKKQDEINGEKAQNYLQGMLAASTLNYMPFSPTFFNQTADGVNQLVNNGAKYYTKTAELNANSFKNFMAGYGQQLANKSGYQSILNSMTKPEPYLDYRSRPVDKNYREKQDAFDKFIKPYESSVNMFSRTYSPIYDSKIGQYRTMTDKEHYQFYKEATRRVDEWVKENYQLKDEKYTNYVDRYSESLKSQGKKVKANGQYFIDQFTREQGRIKKEVIAEQFGDDALINQ